jgi:hypothetical protein
MTDLSSTQEVMEDEVRTSKRRSMQKKKKKKRGGVCNCLSKEETG